jgi:arginyl-tRNA synthetase
VADDFEVHRLTYYAHDLARAIHVFYKNVPVLAADQPVVLQGRLQLVVAARVVLGKTLDLLGISKPEVM